MLRAARVVAAAAAKANGKRDCAHHPAASGGGGGGGGGDSDGSSTSRFYANTRSRRHLKTAVKRSVWGGVPPRARCLCAPLAVVAIKIDRRPAKNARAFSPPSKRSQNKRKRAQQQRQQTIRKNFRYRLRRVYCRQSL